MRKQVLPVDPSTRPLSHVQRSAHRHVTCMPDENCAVGACSCRHQVSRGRDASSGHPGRHVPRYDPQTSGGAAEAASRRPGGRGGSAFDEEGGGHLSSQEWRRGRVQNVPRTRSRGRRSERSGMAALAGHDRPRGCTTPYCGPLPHPKLCNALSPLHDTQYHSEDSVRDRNTIT